MDSSKILKTFPKSMSSFSSISLESSSLTNSGSIRTQLHLDLKLPPGSPKLARVLVYLDRWSQQGTSRTYTVSLRQLESKEYWLRISLTLDPNSASPFNLMDLSSGLSEMQSQLSSQDLLP